MLARASAHRAAGERPFVRSSNRSDPVPAEPPEPGLLYEYEVTAQSSWAVIIAETVKQVGLFVVVLPLVLMALNVVLPSRPFSVAVSETGWIGPRELAGFGVALCAEIGLWLIDRGIRRRIGWRKPARSSLSVREELERWRADRAVTRQAALDARAAQSPRERFVRRGVSASVSALWWLFTGSVVVLVVV